MIGGKQTIRARHPLGGLAQFFQHGGNIGQERSRFSPSVFNGFQPGFPFCCQGGRFEQIRQDGNDANAFLSRHQGLGFLVAFAFHIATGDQLFQNPGAGGRSSQSFSLRVLGHIFHASRFHSSQQRVFCITLGRGGLSFFHNRGDRIQFLAFFQFGQGWLRIPVTVSPASKAALEGSFGNLPAHFRDRLTPGGKEDAFAFQGDCGFFVFVIVAQGSQQTHGNQVKNIQFPGRQIGQLFLRHFHGGDDGVVIGHLIVIDYLTGMKGQVQARRK